MTPHPPKLEFTIYMRPVPQGSKIPRIIPGTQIVTMREANKKHRPFRSELTAMAKARLFELGVQEPMFGKQVPVRVVVDFGFLQPPSAKKRAYPSVPPDADKLARSLLDSLTGVAFLDDAQVVILEVRKSYQAQDRVTVMVEAA